MSDANQSVLQNHIAGCRVPDAGCGCRVPGAGCRVLPLSNCSSISCTSVFRGPDILAKQFQNRHLKDWNSNLDGSNTFLQHRFLIGIDVGANGSNGLQGTINYLKQCFCSLVSCCLLENNTRLED